MCIYAFVMYKMYKTSDTKTSHELGQIFRVTARSRARYHAEVSRRARAWARGKPWEMPFKRKSIAGKNWENQL